MFHPAMFEAMQQMQKEGHPEYKDMMKQMGLPEDFDFDAPPPPMKKEPSESRPISEVSRLLEWVSEEHGVLHQEGRYEAFVNVLKEHLPGSLQRSSPEEICPAIDLNSGVAVRCVELGKEKTLRNYVYFVPTESNLPLESPVNIKAEDKDKLPKSRFEQLKAALQYFWDTDNDGPVLCADVMGMAMYKGSKVKLTGLAREGYNGRKGKVLGLDKKSGSQIGDPDLRLGVQLETKSNPISLKPANMQRTDGGLKWEEAIKIEKDRELLKKMKVNAREVHSNIIETWENLKQYDGNVGVLTCISHLRGNPIEEPMDEEIPNHIKNATMVSPSWRKVLVLANRLLRKGGLCLTYDRASSDDDYGSEEIMKEHVENLSLDLELVERKIPIDKPDEDPMILMLWRKSA